MAEARDVEGFRSPLGSGSALGYPDLFDQSSDGKKFTVQLRAYDKAGNVKYTAKRTYRR